VDLNATRAAIRAGYSKKTAKSIGQENLTKPDIVGAILEAQKERKRLMAEAERPAGETSPNARIKALELLGKHLGMFQDRYQNDWDEMPTVIETDYGDDYPVE
jgi:phage terminase small subunit